MSVNPMIGVRHEPVERCIAAINGVQYNPYGVPTLCTNVGYLSPEATYWEYTFTKGEPILPTARRIADGVRTYGLPWMRNNSSLEAVVNWHLPQVLGEDSAERLLAAFIVLGKPRDELERFMETRLAGLTREVQGRTIVNERVQAFFNRARKYLDQRLHGAGASSSVFE